MKLSEIILHIFFTIIYWNAIFFILGGCALMFFYGFIVYIVASFIMLTIILFILFLVLRKGE